MSNDFSNIKNLSSKIIKIMNDVRHLRKGGKNKVMNYTFAQEAEVSMMCGEAMCKHGVVMLTSIVDKTTIRHLTLKGTKSFLTTVKIDVTFIDVDSGESFTGSFFGEGSDYGDKGGYKAITGAVKYALLKTFLIGTDDEPERENDLDIMQKEYDDTYYKQKKSENNTNNTNKTSSVELSIEDKKRLTNAKILLHDTLTHDFDSRRSQWLEMYNDLSTLPNDLKNRIFSQLDSAQKENMKKYVGLIKDTISSPARVCSESSDVGSHTVHNYDTESPGGTAGVAVGVPENWISK